MADTETQEFKIKSWATPTDAEIKQFKALPLVTQRKLLEAELERGERADGDNKNVSDLLTELIAG